MRTSVTRIRRALRGLRPAWLLDHAEPLSTDIILVLARPLILQGRLSGLVLTTIAILAICVVAIEQEPAFRWPYYWVAGDIALNVVRRELINRAVGDIEGGRLFWFHTLLVASSVWCAGVGLTGFAFAATGNGLLVGLIGTYIAGISGFIATRNSGFPRLAIFNELLVSVPFIAGLLVAHSPWAFAFIIQRSLGFYGNIHTTRGRFEQLLRLIRAERFNHDLARRDVLTGLSNRQQLADRLSAHDDGPVRAAVLCLDLDGFKQVNDTLGHAAGDLLLQHAARRIRAQVRDEDLVARIGGDEFVIVLEGGDAADARAVANRIITTLTDPIALARGTIAKVGVSIGSSTGPDDADDYQTLILRADKALYAAKRARRGSVVSYSESRLPPFARAVTDSPALEDAVE